MNFRKFWIPVRFVTATGIRVSPDHHSMVIEKLTPLWHSAHNFLKFSSPDMNVCSATGVFKPGIFSSNRSNEYCILVVCGSSYEVDR